MNLLHRSAIGVSLLTIMIALITFGSILCPYTPSSPCLDEKNIAPSLSHWFGTDDLGRDMLARTLQGIRISAGIGMLSAIIDLAIGGLWGSIAGFSSPGIDKILMRFAEIIYSIPYLLVVILASIFIGTGIIPIITAMICIGWIHMARLVRHLVQQIRQTDYILAAQTLGVSKRRQFFAHMVPNIIGPIVAACMLSMPHAIFAEAFLSFLGIGIQPPLASLGSLINDAIPSMRFYPWRLAFPSICISLLILSLMLIADSLRNYYDPKQRFLSQGDL